MTLGSLLFERPRLIEYRARLHITYFIHVLCFIVARARFVFVGTLTQSVNGSAAFSTFDNTRRKMSLGVFNTLAGVSFDKSSGSDSSRRSSSPDVPINEQVTTTRDGQRSNWSKGVPSPSRRNRTVRDGKENPARPENFFILITRTFCTQIE